jgi:hypothetical protein
MQKRILYFLVIFFVGSLHAQSFNENFDHVDSLFLNGWVKQNNSSPLGPDSWQQDAGNFAAQNGPVNSSIVCGFRSIPLGQSGDISNWLLTPTINFINGDSIVFWTISYQNAAYADRLEVRLNRSNTTDVGSDPSSVGDFDTTFLVINPTLTTSGGAYPMIWTRYAFKIDGVSGSQPCRLGFRYFVTDGGQTGTNGSTIGIDHFQYKSTLVGIEDQTPLLAFVQLLNGELLINVPGATHPFSVELLDMSGKTIYHNEYDETAAINIGDYSNGVYMIKIIYEGKYLIKKISF